MASTVAEASRQEIPLRFTIITRVQLDVYTCNSCKMVQSTIIYAVGRDLSGC